MKGGAQLASAILKNRRLLVSLVYRELKESVAGSVLGSVWLLLSPLFTVLLYLFLFAGVLQIKIGSSHDLPGNYAIYILSGLIPWLMASEVMNRACYSVLSHTSVVKEVVFPIEVLPVKTYFVTSVSYVVSYLVLFVYVLSIRGGFPLTYLLLPVVLIIQAVLLLGLSMLFAAITPFFRDWARVIALLTQFAIYMTPIVYVFDWLPAPLQTILYLNPFSYMTWVFQDVLFYGEVTRPYAWVVFTVMAVVVYFWGAAVFWKLKSSFGNVL